jgi:hypothetical protein
MDVVVKDGKLTADQKDAMLEGYTRMEHRQIFALLTPEQQRDVHQRIHAYKAAQAAEQAAKKKQSPPN